MKAILLLISFLAVSLSIAEEVLPTGFPLNRYTALWEDSPFNREVVKPVETKIESNFGKDIVLEGVVNDQVVGPIAYLRDLKKNEPIVVTSKESETSPYRILTTSKSNDPAETTVTITDGDETAEIGFQSNLLTQRIATPNPVNPNQNRANEDDREDARAARARAAANLRNNQGTTPQPAGGNAPNQPNPNAQPQEDDDPLDTDTRRRKILLPNRPGVAQ
ncbi:MAG: hypothetical protein AAGC68_14840 [Verrucomicrobiota bacterium]